MKNIIVVDDFYKNPDSVRDFALSIEYQTRQSKNWPGQDSVDAYPKLETIVEISHIVNEEITIRDQNKSGHFRITKDGESGSQHIHYDPNPGLSWAGVVYLTPVKNEIKESGTKFWRHKKYGWEKMPSSCEANLHGIFDTKDMKNFFETDGVDETKWDEVLNIPFKYNRLILFRPWMFHSGGTPFGNDLYTCRLVQLHFFHNLTGETHEII